MTVTNRKVTEAARKVTPELAAAALVSKPKPGTSAWLRAQREAREAREAAELAAYRAGGTDEDAAAAARAVVSERSAYRTYRDSNSDSAAFAKWGAAYDLTRATQPLVRGTRSLGGGLVPVWNLSPLS